MKLYEIVRELYWTLADVWQCGDLAGHLSAWWEIVSGKVEVE